MRSPYGLRIVESCLTCPLRHDRVFCDLPPKAVEKLNAITSTATYPKGALLFVEGQPPRGVFVICSGRAKLSASSANGKVMILRVAEPGELVGLPGTISGKPYEVTAETLVPTQANFIPRESFLQFLSEHGEAAVRVAQHLSMELSRAYEQATRIALAPTARAKLAGLLLEWGASLGNPSDKLLRFQLTLTHEEIGELIGSSRETVSRLLSGFRRKGLIQMEGSLITVPDRAKLATILG